MKKLTRKLFISVLVAVFAFVALGTSTYAWITLSTAAQIQSFEAKVEAGDAGIELSENYIVPTLDTDEAKQAAIEAATWTTELTLSDGLKATFKELDDVTTDDGKTFYDYESAIVDGKNVMVKGAAGSATGKYIEFPVYVKRSNATATAATNIRVNSAKVVFTNVTPVDGTFTYNNGTESITADNLFATNALRMSLTCGSNTVIYEQNTTENRNTAGSDKDGFAHKYAASQNIGIEYVQPEYEKTANAANFLAASSTDVCPTIVTLAGTEVAEIKIRLWIEGWDNECHAQILTQSFKVALAFEVRCV